MAKQNCALCGVEVGLIGQQKLADGNYICRKTCAKRVMRDFDLIGATLYSVKEHIKQIEDGTRIYEKLFVPRKKSLKRPGSGMVFVAEDIGLLAKVEVRYKIFVFGKSSLACVYRLADLYGYEFEQEVKVAVGNVAAGQKTSQTKTINQVHYYFWDTAGMSDFLDKISSGIKSYKKVEKYYNTLFGIQKTLGNIGNTWKNQISAIKAAGGAVKAAVTGSNDLEARAGDAAGAMERAQYGDRTEWKAKADAALRGV